MKLNLPTMQKTIPYIMQETLSKMLSCHYRNLPKIFSNGFPIMKCKAILENVI